MTEREKEKEKRGDDVFKPPYNPNLYVGELKDEDEGTEYVVLVSEFWVFVYLVRPSVNAKPTLVVVVVASLLHPGACFFFL